MNSKTRVHAALRRQPTDRVPIFLWFHPETQARLAAALGIPVERVADALGDDVRQAWVNNNAAMEGVQLARDGDSFTDPWGISWVKEGPFNQILRPPLREADEAAVRAYRFPYTEADALLRRMEAVAGQAATHFIGMDVSPCVFEMANRLRGMEGTLLDLAEDPGLAATLCREAADFAAHLAEQGLARYDVDWLWTGDDVAGQQALMMDPETWRRLIKPELRRVFEVGRKHGTWIAYHCCGALRPIIPDLIEMGLHVLNPIQCGCPGMNALDLKREFGRHLTFMGGVDTIDLLPKATPQEVYDATRRLIDGMTADGGYILAASHTVPPETPLANIKALYAAAGVALSL